MIETEMCGQTQFVVPEEQRIAITEAILAEYSPGNISRLFRNIPPDSGTQIAVFSKEYLTQLMLVCSGVIPHVYLGFGDSKPYSHLPDIVIGVELVRGFTNALDRIFQLQGEGGWPIEVKKAYESWRRLLGTHYDPLELGVIIKPNNCDSIVIGFEAHGPEYKKYEQIDRSFLLVTGGNASVLNGLSNTIKGSKYDIAIGTEEGDMCMTVARYQPGKVIWGEGHRGLPYRLPINSNNQLCRLVEEKVLEAWANNADSIGRSKSAGLSFYAVYPDKYTFDCVFPADTHIRFKQ
jgi:hypothetical protein